MDLSTKITIVLAATTAMSPIFTTLINCFHDIRVRKLNIKEEQKKNDAYYQKQIYINYIEATSRRIETKSAESVKQYTEAYTLALLLFPDKYHDEIIKIDDYISTSESFFTTKKALADLAVKFRKDLKI